MWPRPFCRVTQAPPTPLSLKCVEPAMLQEINGSGVAGTRNDPARAKSEAAARGALTIEVTRCPPPLAPLPDVPPNLEADSGWHSLLHWWCDECGAMGRDLRVVVCGDVRELYGWYSQRRMEPR